MEQQNVTTPRPNREGLGEGPRYVVGLGEVLWDVLPEGKKLGGAPANFAYHAGQFIGMDNTIAVSALGEDKLAEETIEALKEHGLNDLLPRVPSGPRWSRRPVCHCPAR